MNEKHKKIYMILISSLFFIIIISWLLDHQNQNQSEVNVTTSMAEIQSKKENEFQINGFTLEHPNVILNPYGNSPLTALILFQTNNEVSPTVTIKGKDELSTFKHTFEKKKEHYLPIYGLYANQENQVLIEYEENGQKKKNTIQIQTDKLPDNMILPTEIKKEKSKLTNDLYFFTPSSIGYTCAYDVNGDVRWYLTNYALWKIDRLKNGHLLVSTERLMNSPYYMTGLYEMDLLGKIYKEYSLPGGYHHDYYEMDNGNLLIASDDFGNENGTVEDYIVEIDHETGKIIKTFDLKNILKMEDGKSENWSNYDWFHNNSVWYDQKTNSITLSGRHQDAVINIDYENGSLNWIIGDSTNWSEEYQKYFFKPIHNNFEWQWSQHAAMITPEGYVFLLDNGNNKSKIKEEYVDAQKSYTRGVMYKINTENMTIEQIWQYGKERGSEFYSPYISDVDYLGKNHYIVHSGGIVYVNGTNSNQPAGFSKNTKLVSDTVELMDNKIIFEMKLPTNNYRVEKMSLYQKNETFQLGNAKKVGNLGKTEISAQKFTPLVNSVSINENYNNHNISINKEIDRLVIKGKFKRENKVNVILYKNLISNYYEVIISKKPYTALCVDIFTEEETEKGLDITKYINQDNLKGTYAIYIEIDGTIYNTKQFVTF
ncbi:MAG: aryl-sulfate sulfotransferase [Bacilli bacterium]|nr:aryl-sulfate sulfotransferase [Bacilli bacterium]